MITYIQGIMLTVLEMICCKMFFETFGKKRSENRWINYGIILGATILGYSIALIFYDLFFLKQILVITEIAFFMVLYLKLHFGKAFILSLLFQGLLLSVDYFTLWLNVSLFNSVAEINESHNVGGYLVTVLAKILLFMVVLMIRKKIGGRSSEVLMDIDWLRFIFFPVFSIFTIIAMIITSGSVKNQKQENVFLVIAFCLAGMNIVVFYLINDILKRETKIRENKIFQIKVQNQTDMYRTVSENFAKQRRMTHEYKNQILCIESLIAAKNYDELEEYVSKVSGHLSTELDYIKTNNVIVDAILNSKYREILDKKIVFIFKINDLSEIGICDEDIVVILSNLLNNAIEACEKCNEKKVIKMKFVKEKDNVIISVKNTYDGELVIEDGEIQTSKKQDIDEHGIGIKNIIDVISKYQVNELNVLRVNQTQKLERDRITMFIKGIVDEGKAKWGESIQKRQASYIKAVLVDFGFVARNGDIMPYEISNFVLLYLMHELHFAGLSDMAIWNHEDWLLFGLDKYTLRDRIMDMNIKGGYIAQCSGELLTISWNYQTMEEFIDATL